MMRSSVSQTGVGASSGIALTGRYTNISLAAVVSGTATYTIQHTLDDTNWFDHEFMVGKTANDDGNYGFPVSQVRINQTAGTGTVTLTVMGTPVKPAASL